MASVSVRDVARRAGVSVGTVSNVLNRPAIVAPSTVAAVQAAIAELGFVRNDAARQLRAGRSRAIGLLVYDVGNPFFAEVARGAEGRATGQGLSILIGNSDEQADREEAYLALFEEQRMHGVLVSPIGDASARIHRLRERGIPGVLIDRTTDDPTISSVAVDDVAGGELAAAHLLAIGRHRLAFIGGPRGIRQVADRLEGARRATAVNPAATLEVIETSSLSVAEGRRVGAELLEREAGARPEALFAANDLVAVGLLQSLFVASARIVPDEIAIIGYDDIAYAGASVVPLSSIRQPSALIGETAIGILLDEAADPATPARQVVFQPELVVRASTGA